MKKGLSPLIAVVLLIAFTITIAAMVAAFSRTFVSDRSEEAFQQAERITANCQFSRITIEAADFNSGDLSATALIRNFGSENITSFEITAFYSATDFSVHTPENADTVLAEGNLLTLTATGLTGTPTSIEVKSNTCPLEAVDTCQYRSGQFNC